MATNWSDYRKANEVEEQKADEGICAKTAPLFLEILEQPFFTRKDLGGEIAKMVQAVLNDVHNQNSKSHSACARHLTAMYAVLSALVTRGEFKVAGLVYKVAPVVAPSVPDAPPITAPQPAPAPQPKK